MPLRDGLSVSGDIGKNKETHTSPCTDVHGDMEKEQYRHAVTRWKKMHTVVWVAMETTMTYSSPAAGRYGLF